MEEDKELRQAWKRKLGGPLKPYGRFWRTENLSSRFFFFFVRRTTSMFESVGLLNYFLPLKCNMDAFCPIIYFHNS
jgi:hypothetical protein